MSPSLRRLEKEVLDGCDGNVTRHRWVESVEGHLPPATLEWKEFYESLWDLNRDALCRYSSESAQFEHALHDLPADLRYWAQIRSALVSYMIERYRQRFIEAASGVKLFSVEVKPHRLKIQMADP